MKTLDWAYVHGVKNHSSKDITVKNTAQMNAEKMHEDNNQETKPINGTINTKKNYLKKADGD